VALAKVTPIRSHSPAVLPQWNGWIRKHNHTVLVSVLAMGLPYARAEELVQDTWEKLATAQREGRLPDVSLPGLAVRQARFLALDELRRHPGAHTHLSPELSARLVDPSSRPDERVWARQTLTRARRALASRPEQEQRIFKLYYVECVGNAAVVASRIGLSAQRVRQILCELRKVLRRATEDKP